MFLFSGPEHHEMSPILNRLFSLFLQAAVSNTEIPKPSIRFPTLRDALGVSEGR